MTQTDKILDYIKKNGSIDPLRAMTELGEMRLASRIHDIRSLGVPVKSLVGNAELCGKIRAEDFEE